LEGDYGVGFRNSTYRRQTIPRQDWGDYKGRETSGDQGDTVTLDDVRMTSIDGEVSIGNPVVSGASVTAEVVGQGKDKKIIVFKYKAKTRYRKKKGHRQQYTDLRVTEITS